MWDEALAFQDNFGDVLTPTLLKAFPVRVVDVHLGEFHSGGRSKRAEALYCVYYPCPFGLC